MLSLVLFCLQASKCKKKHRSSNPFVQACLAEMGGCIQRRQPADITDDDDDGGASSDDLSDLDDFIVCKPGRDYRALFAQQFKYRCSEQPTR